MTEGQKIAPILISIIFLSQLCWTQQEDFQYHYSSKYGLLCYDGCHQNGKSYYWCKTRKGWDYCSVRQNTDYKGNECKREHPCDLHDEDYRWCYTTNGEWGYCGSVEPKKVNNKHLYKSSTFQIECKDRCSYDNSEELYGCNTHKGWDYCSPSPDVTYKNKPCRFDHSCSSHGYKYTWCWTDTDWGYCGIIEKSEICDSVTLSKRVSDHIEEICLRDDFNEKMTMLMLEWDPKAITEGRKWSNEMSQIISQWDNEYLDSERKSNVITTTNLQLGLQGLVQRNNVQYTVLQIQRKMQDPHRISPTVAEVYLPKDVIPEKHVHQAIIESFCNRAKIYVKVSSDSGYQTNADCVQIPN
ncbi:hypothetical protein KOW79_022360 [Hemibagrus wyckioides]|uniref:Uncharacterized protein n=1 Tax=Hemibagrus wyckioides TaxID=337641 RepID=A0A9D3SCM9_9TELE|nr:uncharacterized protein LOC131348850 [Hemibagrus wyckioides]KAG7313864.1 hypothetical protein KOW79_022360 [Hemibagrus wyckioides]